MSLDLLKYTAVARGLTAIFESERMNYTPFYPKIATVRKSTTNEENYAWMGAMPGMREWLGDRIANDLRAATFLVENKDYEMTVEIPKKAIDDDRYGMYGDVIGNMAEEAVRYPDEVLASDIENAGSIPVADGQYFYDSDHSWGESGTQSNDISVDIVTPASPTATEFKTAFQAAVAKMFSFVNDKGKKFWRGMVQSMTGLAVGIPVNMRQAAYEAFESVIISNSTNVVIDKPQIITLPELTTTTKFHVWKLDGRLKPFLFQERQALKTDIDGLNSRRYKDLLFMVDSRFRVRPLFWPYAVRVTLT